MKKKHSTKRNIREIRSDDEVSDSDVVNETDKFHEDIDKESEFNETLLPLKKYMSQADGAFSEYVGKGVKLMRCYLLNIS
ncbi:unnamed protein product [Oikopleura dioica]|uniref:Uncharacterized protein n=1 Tax=Oikopleura dioica TaxID=34765 RepID=E4WTA9_OIKDI|nr:unnamed protein product [Oikopleura dioica]